MMLQELTEEMQEIVRMAFERRRQLHLQALASGRMQGSLTAADLSAGGSGSGGGGSASGVRRAGDAIDAARRRPAASQRLDASPSPSLVEGGPGSVAPQERLS